MIEDFSKAPRTLTELRAERERNGQLWTPRDALVHLLRQIDNGEIKPSMCIVTLDGDEAGGFAVTCAGVDRVQGIGMLMTGVDILNRGR